MQKFIYIILFTLVLAFSTPLISQQKEISKEVKVMVIDAKEGSSNEVSVWVDDKGAAHQVKKGDMVFIGEGKSTSDKDVTVDVNVENENGVELRVFTVTVSGDGEKEVIEWNDKEEISDDVIKRLEELGVDIEVFKTDGENQEITVTVDDASDGASKNVNVSVEKEIVDGEEKRMISISVEENGESLEWEWEDDGEIPQDIIDELDSHEIDVVDMLSGDGQTMTVIVDDEDGHSKNHMIKHMMIKLEEGEELPDDIKKMLEEKGVNLENLNVHGEHIEHKEYRIKIKDDKGEEKILEWNGEGGMPEEMKEIMEKEGLHKMHDVKTIQIKGGNGNKAQLGVMIENDDDHGVVIIDVIPESAASQAGLESGDIILKVDDVDIADIESLLSSLSYKLPGDSALIEYKREGDLNNVSVVLKRSENLETEAMKTVKIIVKEAKCDTENMTGDQNVDVLFKSIVKDGESNIFIMKTDDMNVSHEADEKVAAPVQLREVPQYPQNRRLKLNEYKAFPNPTSGVVRLQFEGDEKPLVVQLTDATGQTVFKEHLNNFGGRFDKDIDLTAFPKGQFFLNVIQDQKIFTESIILQ